MSKEKERKPHGTRNTGICLVLKNLQEEELFRKIMKNALKYVFSLHPKKLQEGNLKVPFFVKIN